MKGNKKIHLKTFFSAEVAIFAQIFSAKSRAGEIC
jgi:hypothetical protein